MTLYELLKELQNIANTVTTTQNIETNIESIEFNTNGDWHNWYVKLKPKTMEEFIQNFTEFRDFLNSPVTEYTVKTLAGNEASHVLKIIRDKFDELNLNNAF